jgi:signal transduction histidine kinase
VQQRTRSEFDRFVLSRDQVNMINVLTAYYQANHSWRGIEAIAVRNPSKNPNYRSYVRAPVTLTDADGTVILSGGRYRRGQQIEPDEGGRVVPINIEGETVGWLSFDALENRAPRTAESLELGFLERFNRAILFGAAGAIVVALLIGVLLARTISRPVRELTLATHAVAQGELGRQVPVRAEDELGELADSFNRMSADLALSNQLRRQMTADVAHELRTPLSIILGYTEALSDGKMAGSSDTFELLHDEAHRLSRLVDDLRVLSLADAGELPLTRRPVLPHALLERAEAAYAEQARQRDIALQVDAAPDLPEIEVDPDRMAQVFNNLVSNALRYTPEGGRIRLAARPAPEAVILSVQDTGRGIAPEDLPRVFERFYRGDKSRHEHGESGLGLAIAKSIVDAHAGTISVESTPGAGTKFAIRLPVSQVNGGSQGRLQVGS